MKQVLLPTIVASVLLVIGIFPIKQYGFYILLRWVVTGTAIYIGYFLYQMKRYNWVWLMGIIAVLFNPLEPIHFSKGVWQVLDLVVAGVFVGLIFFLKKKVDFFKKKKLE